jgi:hypothetical protein
MRTPSLGREEKRRERERERGGERDICGEDRDARVQV